MSQDKLQAYAQTQKSSMSSREIEAMAFTKPHLSSKTQKSRYTITTLTLRHLSSTSYFGPLYRLILLTKKINCQTS